MLTLDRLEELQPASFKANGALFAYLWRTLDARLLELCRLTSARHLKCAPEQSIRYTRAGVPLASEEEIASLPAYDTSSLFSAHDRAALVFAEQSLIDAHGVTDEMTEALKPAITDETLYRFSLAVGMIESWQRLLIAARVPSSEGKRAAARLGIETVQLRGEPA